MRAEKTRRAGKTASAPVALALLKALAKGDTVRRTSAGWQHEGAVIADQLVNRLVRADLVRVGPNGLALLPTGEARLADLDAGPRLLVERAVPEARSNIRSSRVTVNLAESPLGWLMARGMISGNQFEAGERLRGDWAMASLGPRVTMRWDATPAATARRGPGAAPDPTTSQLAAKQRVEAALESLGSGLSDVAWRVICNGEGLEAAERGLGWPARAGKLVLAMALDRLVRFYDIG